MNPGYLYVVLAADGTAKVGHSYRSPRSRLLAITADHHGGSLELARVVAGTRYAERAIHRELKPHRIAGAEKKNICEWYKDQAAVLELFSEWPQAVCEQCGEPWPKLRKVTTAEANSSRWKCGPRTSVLCFCGREAPRVTAVRAAEVIV